MNEMENKELNQLLRKSIARNEAYIQNAEGNLNPQVIELVNKAIGKISLSRDVIDFLRGDKHGLKIEARGTLI
jgi:hypothetical protein